MRGSRTALAAAAAALVGIPALPASAAGWAPPPELVVSGGASASSTTPAGTTSPPSGVVTVTNPPGPYFHAGMSSPTGQFHCPVGASGAAASVTWIYFSNQITGTIQPGSYSYTCNYPPAPVYSTITCPVSTSGTGTGPLENPTLPPKTIAYPARQSAFAAGGETSPAACRGSLADLASLPLTSPGYWRLTLTVGIVSCTVETFPGTSQASRVTGCGPVEESSRQVLATLSCAGWHLGWSRPAGGFGANACKSGTPGAPAVWSCPTPAWPAVSLPGPLGTSTAGQLHRIPPAAPAGSAYQVLDDGRASRGAWPSVSPTGLRDVHSYATWFQARPGSTPLRVGDGEPGMQPFVLQASRSGNDLSSGAATTGVTVAGQRPAYLGFQLASGSVNGAPAQFTLDRRVSFQALVPTPQVIIKGVNIATGTITTSQSTVWEPMQGDCASQPLVMAVFRGRNTVR